MQPLELALFISVVVLAVGLIGTIAWPYLRARPARAAAVGPLASAAPQPPRGPSLVCPACHREFEPGLQFCPHDARDLVPATDPTARLAPPGTTCPTCKRSFDAGKKFCAFDGDELVPLPLAPGASDLPPVAMAGALGKICPNCARRYEAEATFCGRDGAELVTVN